MNWSAVQSILASLPSGYTRSGSTFADWQNSLTAGVSRLTTGIDTVNSQTTFATAQGNWLTLWGTLLGVSRTPPESDTAYSMRITETVVSGRGTPVGIESYLLEALGITSTVVENFPTVGYAVSLQPGTTLTSFQKAAFAGNLNAVRPAGVPYNVTQLNGGLFLGTGNYLGGTGFQGSWLQPLSVASGFSTAPSTNSVVSSLPTTWITDITVNPSLA